MQSFRLLLFCACKFIVSWQEVSNQLWEQFYVASAPTASHTVAAIELLQTTRTIPQLVFSFLFFIGNPGRTKSLSGMLLQLFRPFYLY